MYGAAYPVKYSFFCILRYICPLLRPECVIIDFPYCVKSRFHVVKCYRGNMLPYDSNTVKPCNLSQAEVRSDTAQVFRAPPGGKMPAQAPHSGSSFCRLLQLYPRILSVFKCEIIVFVPVCVRYKDKCNTILFFKASHKLYLMLMYIGKGNVSVLHSLHQSIPGFPVQRQYSQPYSSARNKPV